MSEKTVIINEQDGVYEIQNNGISEFALIGLLECILFGLKTARSKRPIVEKETAGAEANEMAQKREQSNAEPEKEQGDKTDEIPTEKPKPEVTSPSKAPELRTRNANAVKAIKALGGEVNETHDYPNATDDDLKTKLEELTEQYKRLKGAKSVKK